MSTAPLLDVQLTAGYRRQPSVLRNVALQVQPGEVLGLVGQSGSGKSTLARAVLRLLERQGLCVTGHVRFRGRDLLPLSESRMRQLRGREISLVLQSPHSCLNPLLRIGTQLQEAWRAHRQDAPDFVAALRDVSLADTHKILRSYPGELSVGMAQRVLIAMAVLHRPALLIADEPTSALDVITQKSILQLFRQLNQQYGTALLYISHDLQSVANLCRRVAILHQGEIVEEAPTEQLFRGPRHPYTQQLVAALLRLPF